MGDRFQLPQVPPSQGAGAIGTITKAIYEPLGYLFGSAGLVEPWQRGVFGLAVGYMLSEVFSLGYFVDDQGMQRPKIWRLNKAEYEQVPYELRDIATTLYPWWFYPVSSAVLLGMFI